MTDQAIAYENKKKHLLIIGGLVLFNLIIYNLFVKTGGYDSSGKFIPYDQAHALKSSLITLFAALPFLSLILGLLVALFPFKKLPYNKKYIRASLLTLLTLNGLIAIGLIPIMVMTAMGSYPPDQQDSFGKNKGFKEKGIQEFKAEIKTLCDSTVYYFDLGLVALENGQEANSISNKIGPKLKIFESQLNDKTLGFQETSHDLGLTEQEYKKVFDDLTAYFQPIQEKHRRLKELGVEIK